VLIFRYLSREVFTTLVALIAILMLVFMSNQLILYLNRAAAGSIPGMIILKLMMLELPNLAGLLLPLGFYMALLLAYGRLYVDNEMTVLQACGYGFGKLLKHSFIMASIVALLVSLIMIYASPFIATERAKLLRTTGMKTLIQTVMPGRFQSLSGGNQVFYVESMSRDHESAKHIFFAKQRYVNDQLQWDILWADKASISTDQETHEDYIVLENGQEYQGIPGMANYQIAEFHSVKARLPHPVVSTREDIRTEKTANLWPLNNPDRAKATELQWRLSAPFMVFALTLIAVPLSRVNPRSGKYAKLLPAVVIYILYANFMFVARNAMMTGKIPWWVGMWWLHILAFLLGLFLVWRNRAKLS